MTSGIWDVTERQGLHARLACRIMDDSFPDYLRRIIRARRLTQAGLARRTGISAGVISKWLADTHKPDLENLRKLSTGIRRPLLEVLVAAGFLTSQEARLRDLPNVEEEQEWEIDRVIEQLASHYSDAELMTIIHSVLGRRPRPARLPKVENP